MRRSLSELGLGEKNGDEEWRWGDNPSSFGGEGRATDVEEWQELEECGEDCCVGLQALSE